MKKLNIHSEITCPNCWAVVHPADFLWISPNTDLRGDPNLGTEALKRFLPSRFDSQGFAIDETDTKCESIACPKCHLPVPRILCDTWPSVVSIIGTPSSGKSYFLAASTWQAQQKLADFNIDFTSADPVATKILGDDQTKLFLNEFQDQLITIEKTQEEGKLYQEVLFGSRKEVFARPFVFSIRPNEVHLLGRSPSSVQQHSLALCLYDNAGENFLPNEASELSPATNHLASSKSLLFVFDPLQHTNFRRQTRKTSNDPQLDKDAKIWRQDEILEEAAKRFRRKTNLPDSEKIDKPLIVVVNKFDVWRCLTPKLKLESVDPYTKTKSGMALDIGLIKKVSDHVEKLLKKLAPEMVSTCRAFCSDVTYIPVSPIGNSPERNEEAEDKSLLGIRPKNIKPIWAEVPLLYAIARSKNALIPAVTRSGRSKSSRQSKTAKRPREIKLDQPKGGR